MLSAILNDLPGILFISATILALFFTGEMLHRVGGMAVELTRKFTHLSSGMVVLSFPWLLTSPWSVGLLTIGFSLLLALGHTTGLLSSVHNVERRTSGAYYYPIAVLGTFWLSGGDPLLFCIPIAVMAVADTGAAIVGQNLGENVYRVYDNKRTLEGSLSFFALAMAICLVGLSLSGRPGWPSMLIVALVAALMATATEAISVRGADNLFIPYTCFLVLDRTLRLGLRDLSGWVEGMLLGAGLVMVSYKAAALTTAGAVTVFVVVTLSWAMGGLPWLMPLAAFYALYIATIPREGKIRANLEEVFPTTVGAMIVVLTFGHFGDPSLFVPYLATLTASGSIALNRMAKVRGWPAIPLVISGALTPLIPVLTYAHEVPFAAIGIATAIGFLAFVILNRVDMAGRRMMASLLAGAVAWAAI